MAHAALAISRQNPSEGSFNGPCTGRSAPRLSPKPWVLNTQGAADSGSVFTVDNAACARFMPLLGRTARRLASRLPEHVELEELVSAGAVGLVLTLRQHGDKPVDELVRLVRRRVVGAMLDHLRSMDHLTRRQRMALSTWQKTKDSLEHAGIDASTSAIATTMGVSEHRAEYIEHRLAAVQMTALLSDEQVQDSSADVLSQLESSQQQAQVVQALKTLPKRLQTILALSYNDSLTYQEISEVLGVSRSRVCQLHGQAIEKLRIALRSLSDDGQQ